VDRTRRRDVTRMNSEIQRALAGGNVVVLFPEGTSWNGHEILPFKSSLLEPIVGSLHPLSVGRITYALEAGSVEHDVCYWGDMTFFPHLVNLMKQRRVGEQASLGAQGTGAATPRGSGSPPRLMARGFATVPE
jgi:lyso-ornithine lipid O-acyltransferase